ncbi:hypothetical protein L195_g027169 [Trifolium pratense]|uniref:Uncharacterized protein n=1 Tax=Trifolium pratense TaxID=57577 RepID=A0A2K3KYE0_TRIPR|nr:hypothetical protein L195_g027169 [Trifolium pratense]
MGVKKIVRWQCRDRLRWDPGLLHPSTCCGKCELRLTLLRKVEVEHLISERTHKPNTLSFELKCGVQLACEVVLKLNMDDPPGCPLVTTQQWYQSRWFDEGFDQLLVSKVFLTKVVRQRVPLNSVTNGGTSVWMK